MSVTNAVFFFVFNGADFRSEAWQLEAAALVAASALCFYDRRRGGDLPTRSRQGMPSHVHTCDEGADVAALQEKPRAAAL